MLNKKTKNLTENVVLNTRIHKNHSAFIKAKAKKDNTSEGVAIRAILSDYINSQISKKTSHV